MNIYPIKDISEAKRKLVEMLKIYYRDKHIGRVSNITEWVSNPYIKETFSEIARHFKKENHLYKILYIRNKAHWSEMQPDDVHIWVSKQNGYLEIWHETMSKELPIDETDVLLAPDFDDYWRRYLAHKIVYNP